MINYAEKRVRKTIDAIVLLKKSLPVQKAKCAVKKKDDTTELAEAIRRFSTL